MDTYHMRLLHGIHEITDPAGLSVLVHAVDPLGAQLPGTFESLIDSGRICGVICTHLASRAAHEQLIDLLVEQHPQLPVVHIGPHPKAEAWTTLDNSAGMRELLEHLLD